MRLAALAICAALAGCAANSGIVPIGGDAFFITKQAATGFSGIGNLKGEAMGQAGAHCAASGKRANVISSSEAQPPYIFGNFPRIELTFKCE